MNWFQKILNKAVANQVQELKRISTSYSLPPVKVGVRYNVDNQGRIVTPTDNKKVYIDDGYNKNDFVYSVINMILDKCVLPDWDLFKVVDEAKLARYHQIMRRKNLTPKEIRDAIALKYEALEPLENLNVQAGKLKELLRYPNSEDTFQDHNRALLGYKLLVGDYYEWAETLTSGARQGIPGALWCLPAHLINIKTSDTFPSVASSYELTTFNKQFSKEEILHEKYWNPNWNINGEQLYGFAPLRAFLKNIDRSNAAKDAATNKFNNGGVEDIAFLDDERISGDDAVAQVNALKAKWYSKEYTGTEAQGKLAWSAYRVGSTHLGNSPVELGIIDSEKWDGIMFCNAYGVPAELFGLVAKTYNNVKEAEAALTTRSAIPLLDTRSRSINRKLQTNWGFKGVNIYVDYDTECFPELQQNVKEVMDGLSLLTMLSPDEEREACSMPLLNTPESREQWVKIGSRQPLSDYQASVVDEALNNANDGTASADGKVKPINGASNSQDGSKGISNSRRLLFGKKESDNAIAR